MASLENLSEDIEKIIRDYTGYTTYNVNAVVHKFERETVGGVWTPANRCYRYRSFIILHIPYYSSASGRPDTYSYDVLYGKDKDGNAVNIGQYFEECKKKSKRKRVRNYYGRTKTFKQLRTDVVKNMVRNDTERRKTLPKSYAYDLTERVYDYTYENAEEILKSINGERKDDEIQVDVISSEPSKYVSRDNTANAFDIQVEILSNDTIVEEGKDDYVMDEFKALVAKGMNIFCGDVFAHGIEPFPEEEVKKRRKEEFVIPESLATGNFWSNLLDKIKFTKKTLTYKLSNTARSRYLSSHNNNEAWWEAYKEEYNTLISGAIKKREKICRMKEVYWDDKIFESKYIVEQKFQLVANTTYLFSKRRGWRMPNVLPELKF